MSQPVEFLRGATAVLAAMAIHEQDSMYDECVRSIGADDLIRQARRDGAMRWSGLDKYVKRVRP